MNRTHISNRGRPNLRAASGFTLIELMITVAIVAILAAIALPSYQNYVMRTHRNAAKACLSQYAQFMERYYTTNMKYDGGTDPSLPCNTEGQLDKRYTISMNRTQTTYTVQAAPTSTQNDSKCGTLSINQIGARSAGTGSPADVAYCW